MDIFFILIPSFHNFIRLFLVTALQFIVLLTF
nr:MAG TPA: hypothetical protein [Caudoviricetes sp.]